MLFDMSLGSSTLDCILNVMLPYMRGEESEEAKMTATFPFKQ